MSFLPYERYRPSEIEWLDELPGHWSDASLGSVTTLIQTGPFGSQLHADDYVEGGVPLINPSHIDDGHLVADPHCTVTVHTCERLAQYRISEHDIIFARRGEMGRCAVAGRSNVGWLCGTGSLIVRMSPGVFPPFAAAYFGTTRIRESLKLSSVGSTMDNLNETLLSRVRLPLPPLSEQIIIARFLDCETAKIRALVYEQTRLIELLKEKRRATIFRAVTKGLDPNVPMKDSGIEWLGEVPERWTLKRLKHISPFLTVGIVVNPSDYVAADGLPYLYGGNISEGQIHLEEARKISEEDSRKNGKTRLSAGDLVTVRVGAPGVTAVVPSSCEGGNCASVMLTTKGDFCSQWLCYAINSRVVRYQVELVQYGAAQEQFNISHAVNFWVPAPTEEEQHSIATALDAQAAKIDGLVAEAGAGIALLQERRSALISAAVTGKIDVRSAAITEVEAA
jgi:type I restriction enzyme S subunit